MALDRQSIEKKDFPIGRRGYEPEAVDAHLARLASELDALQKSQSRGGESLASAASEHVRAIVEAAETSAAEIEAEAAADAATIRAEADANARRTRDEAVARSQEHVSRVGEATALMLQRVDAMETELGALIESLRTGANRLNADLSLLQGNMGDLYGAAGGGAASAPPAAPAPAVAAPAAPAESAWEPVPEDDAEIQAEQLAAPEPDAPFVPEPAATAEQPAAAAEGSDVEGARLVALNMALNGQSRDETDRYLADNFDLADRHALLDEVYATVEG